METDESRAPPGGGSFGDDRAGLVVPSPEPASDNAFLRAIGAAGRPLDVPVLVWFLASLVAAHIASLWLAFREYAEGVASLLTELAPSLIGGLVVLLLSFVVMLRLKASYKVPLAVVSGAVLAGVTATAIYALRVRGMAVSEGVFHLTFGAIFLGLAVAIGSRTKSILLSVGIAAFVGGTIADWLQRTANEMNGFQPDPWNWQSSLQCNLLLAAVVAGSGAVGVIFLRGRPVAARAKA